MDKSAKAALTPVRQRTQYTCVATSVTMALNAMGKDLTEDQVNRILGAEPKKGARWEEAIATIQYFGCRATLTAPSTLAQIKSWTDSGKPVLIAWNPEGRPWSHASCVFHVEQGPPETWAEDVGDDAIIQGSGKGMYVWVADPNIPNPSKTYRIVHEDEFYAKWGEDWGDFIVRRPALLVDLEITTEGRQVMASDKSAGRKGKRPQRTTAPKDPKDNLRMKVKPKKTRDESAQFLAENRGYGNPGAHHTRSRDVAKGRSRKPKHKGRSDWKSADAETAVANTDVQSSFYKTLEGETIQLTPLRLQPDYGEKMMDINEMLEQLKQEENQPVSVTAMAETLKMANTRPAGGLYGYTKQTQRDVLASVRKVQKSANRIAKTIYAKDKNTFNFLHLHAERSNSLSARILCAAMENIGPKVASTKTAARFNPDTPKAKAALEKVYKLAAKEYVQALYKHLGSNKKAFQDAWSATSPGKSGKFEDWVAIQFADRASRGWFDAAREVTMEMVGWLNDPSLTNQLKLGSFEAVTKTAAGHGMYGYRVKTAKLALQACLDLSQEAGSVAYDLHTRRTAKYAKITSFLKDHSKRGRCRYARLLLRFYPEMNEAKTAASTHGYQVKILEKAIGYDIEAFQEFAMTEGATDTSWDPKTKSHVAYFSSRSRAYGFADDAEAKYGKNSIIQRMASEDEKKADDDEKEAKHEKGKKMKLEDMPPELQAEAKNPANHFKKKKAAELIALAEAFIKDAGGCDSPKLPDALKAQCKKREQEGKDSDDSDDKEKKEKEASGCDNLPPALKKNCEDGPPNAKKKDSDSEEANSGDEKEAKLLGNPIKDAIKDGLNPKKASRNRLTTRIANGELQRGEVRYAAEDQDDEDQKESSSQGRSQLPGEEEANQAQPKIKGEMGYNPGSTEKKAATPEELKEKSEGRTYLPGDEEADKLQPDMNQHGFDAGAAVKLSADYETVTGVTDLPDGAKLYWVE